MAELFTFIIKRGFEYVQLVDYVEDNIIGCDDDEGRSDAESRDV